MKGTTYSAPSPSSLEQRQGTLSGVDLDHCAGAGVLSGKLQPVKNDRKLLRYTPNLSEAPPQRILLIT